MASKPSTFPNKHMPFSEAKKQFEDPDIYCWEKPTPVEEF
jgi:hypothetical protein